MVRWEQRYLGHDGFPQGLSPAEIERFFTPTPAELLVVLQRRTPTNRIAFALQIGFLKMTGRSLNSVELVPTEVLTHLGRAVGCAPPRIASIRAFYRRRRTLFDHQTAARGLLRRRDVSDHGLRGLTAYLRREAISTYTGSDLASKARIWLIERDYLLPREREIRRHVIRALRHQEAALYEAICAATDASLREGWADRLLEPTSDGTTTRLEWLQTPPASRRVAELADHGAKIDFLRELGADRLKLDSLPLVGLRHFHRQVVVRKPATLARIREPRRTLELACFLRLRAMELTDTALDLLDRQIATIWRQSREQAEAKQAVRLARFRTLLGELGALTDDSDLDADALRTKLKGLITPLAGELDKTQVLAIRRELADRSVDLRRLIASARQIGLEMPAEHGLAKALAQLDSASGKAKLPADTDNPFGRSWQSLIDQPDRSAALKSYTAATAMLLKRALRNQSVSAQNGLAHCATEARLIPPSLWERDRARYLRDMSLPRKPEQYLRRIEAALELGMAGLAEAVASGLVTIDARGVHLPRRKRAPKDPVLERARRSLSEHCGAPQMSEILIEIDRQTRFSWSLLGRPARSEAELIALYVAVLALGSDLTVAALDRMVPGLDADTLGAMVGRLVADRRLRAANDAVVAFMRGHRAASLWGRGLYASADMVSLDTTAHLWNARLDPRRKGPAIGTYPHVLDQWPIFYDQPIVLGRRQAGAAIEGALRQSVVDQVERVAVDTHGFTHFALALGKNCGIDLCPRLASIRTRKLYLPRGYSGRTPDVLKPIIANEQVSRRTIARGWDAFARVSASVKDGWYPAPDALDQYGSAAQGDPVHGTGVAIGKLLRSIYLCDYFGKPDFQHAILDLLNQGEAVHSLQRAINPGTIGAKHGRSHAEITAISGALTLLTNIVMAWNTIRIQALSEDYPDEFPDNIIASLAPIGHAHINMHGIIAFKLGTASKSLIVSSTASLGDQNLGKAES